MIAQTCFSASKQSKIYNLAKSLQSKSAVPETLEVLFLKDKLLSSVTPRSLPAEKYKANTAGKVAPERKSAKGHEKLRKNVIQVTIFLHILCSLSHSHNLVVFLSSLILGKCESQ